MAHGRYHEAADLLRVALALWRGPALADLHDLPFVRDGVVQLEEARLAALEDRLECDLALRRHALLVSELEALVARHPLRERLHGQLMVALYRAGRQADALRVYSRARRRLVDELGIEPTPALQRLEQAILVHDPCLAAPAEVPGPAGGLLLPGSLQVGQPLRFVGREAERAVLERCWMQAATGARQAVLVGGEPGIGKTRLATELALAAHGEGAVVLHGRCDGELGLAYQPFIEALRFYLAGCPPPVLAALAESYGGELGRLLPELGSRTSVTPGSPARDPDSERYLLFEAVTSVLETAAVDRPVVLVLDDLHWAAKPTLLLLRHLLTSARPMAVLVIGTYRDSELGRSHPLSDLLADLRRTPGVERMCLGGLSGAEVEDMVEDAFGRPLDDRAMALADAVRRETEGNPFFVNEILRHLTESGAVSVDDGRWTASRDLADVSLPDSVLEVIARRLRRLSDAANRCLRLGSVIGVEFELALLESLAGLGEEELLDALAEARGAKLVAEVTGRPGRFRFSHALIRQSVYQELGPARRGRLHRRVAQALEQLVGTEPSTQLAELAHHWFQSLDPADRATAAEYARRAGDWALGALAYEEAADHYERALHIAEKVGDEASRRYDLLLSLGDAQRRASHPHYRQTLARAATLARDLEDPARLAAAALGSSRPCSWFFAVGRVDEPLVALYEEALEALGPEDSVLRARLLSQLAVELYWTPSRDRRRVLCEEAMAVARRAGDREALAHVVASSIVARWDPSTLDERFGLCTELIRLGTELASQEILFQGRLLFGGTLLEAGDGEGARRELQAALDLAAHLHQPFYLWLTGTLRTMQVILGGGPAREDAAAETFQVGQASGQPDAPLIFAMDINQIRWDQGRLTELEHPLPALPV